MPRYLAFYKPYEVLSQFTDQSIKQGARLARRSTLKDFITIPGIYPAGRLDYRSEGLLVLSDDGRFIQRMSDPRFAHLKTYLAQVEGIATPEAVEKANREIILPGVQTRPVEIEVIAEPELPPRSKPVRPYHPTTWLRIVLSEGKKHEVRRITAAIGFPTLRLVRISIGPVHLGELQPGEWRDLSLEEISGFSGHRTGNHRTARHKRDDRD